MQIEIMAVQWKDKNGKVWTEYFADNERYMAVMNWYAKTLGAEPIHKKLMQATIKKPSWLKNE